MQDIFSSLSAPTPTIDSVCHLKFQEIVYFKILSPSLKIYSPLTLPALIALVFPRDDV